MRFIARAVAAATAVIAVACLAIPPVGRSAVAPLATVSTAGTGFTAAGGRLSVWGFNYGASRGENTILAYFEHPGPTRLAAIRRVFAAAKALGANTMRVYLELPSFMAGPDRARPAALQALARVLGEAERQGLYLDVTGDLVWRTKHAPDWYDAMSEGQRWQVQATFWRAVAAVGAGSPAVLAYELMSEPAIVADGSSWYAGALGGYHFVQYISIRGNGRDPDRIARTWTSIMRDAVRSQDTTHLITIGLLPALDGPFRPANVADLLDFITVHEYPEQNQAGAAATVIRRFAATGKPVLLGETYTLQSDLATQEEFLRRSHRYLAGTLSFFDGTAPTAGHAASDRDDLYLNNLRLFVDLRGLLTGRDDR